MRIICLSKVRGEPVSQPTHDMRAARKQVYRASCVRRESCTPPPREPRRAPRALRPASNRSSQQLADAVRPVSRRRRHTVHVFHAPALRFPRTPLRTVAQH